MNKSSIKKFLHVGCGTLTKKHTTAGFNTDHWQELRLDIDESVKPDIIGSVLDLNMIDSESFDAIFTSHNIEHVHSFEISIMLGEFKRVLRKDGYIVICCPNLVPAAKLILEDKITEPAYISPAGPITPLDMLYGYQKKIEQGSEYMAHKTGFTPKSLGEALLSAGFETIALTAIKSKFDMWAIASKSKQDGEEMQRLVSLHVPNALI